MINFENGTFANYVPERSGEEILADMEELVARTKRQELARTVAAHMAFTRATSFWGAVAAVLRMPDRVPVIFGTEQALERVRLPPRMATVLLDLQALGNLDICVVPMVDDDLRVFARERAPLLIDLRFGTLGQLGRERR